MENNRKPLELRRAESAPDGSFESAWSIYDRSFPYCEKRSRAQLLDALRDPLYRPWLCFEQERVVGIALCWRMPEALYLEHLAVDPDRRGGRIGSRILDLLDREGLPIVLEIEPPEDGPTRRRRDFYLRNGFTENPQHYVHPSFCRPFTPHRLVLLSRPAPLTDSGVAEFEAFVHGTVLRYSDHACFPNK